MLNRFLPGSLMLIAFLAVASFGPQANAASLGADVSQAESTDGFPARPGDVSIERWSGLQSIVQQAKLFPSPLGIGGSNGRVGYSVSISGNRALVGGFGLIDTGAALVLADTGSGWELEAVLLPSDGANGDNFGFSVSLSGNRALVGAFAHDVGSNNTGAAYVFDFDGTSWSEQAKLSADDAANGDFLGYSVALDGDRALVGAISDDDGGSSSGSAYVFDFDGTAWSQAAKLTADDATAGDALGFSVSVSGARALIGAWQDDDAGNASGSAYVFRLDGGLWSQQAKLTANDAAADDQFGYSVSLSGDRALIGARFEDQNGGDSGAAYVFDFDGTDWSESAKLVASDGASGDNFGDSVSLSGDRALIGAYRNDDNGSDSGSAYVFELDGLNWAEQEILTASDASNGDQYAFSVSLDGDTALIGAPRVDDDGSDSGGVYIATFDSISSTWNEVAKQGAGEGAAGDEFGFSVSIDGSRALIGAYQDDGNGSNSGAAYIFEFKSGAWTEVAKLEPSDGAGSDRFGYSVSLSGDTALVGAYLEDEGGADAGAAYVFSWNGSAWAETAKLTASDATAGDRFAYSLSLDGAHALIGAVRKNSEAGAVYRFSFDGSVWSEDLIIQAFDSAAGQRFGESVSLSGDRALVGAMDDSAIALEAGAAYVIDLLTAQQIKLTASDAAESDHFGRSVSLSGDHALIGADGNDDAGVDSGSAYVFDFDGSTWSQSVKLAALDAGAQDQFGYSVSLDGNRAVIGAYRDSDSATAAGSSYVFAFDGSTWTQDLKLLAPDASIEDQFGISVGVSGDRILIGANLDDDRGNNSGSAYVYSFNQPPIAQPDALSTDEDNALVGDVLLDNGSGADSDPDGDNLVVQSPGTVTVNGIGGSVDLSASGSFTYTPPLNASGVATFDYTIADPSGETDSATVTITVLPVNDQPSFVAADPDAVLEDAGSQTISGWAAFDAGAPNELQNVLGYTVSNVEAPSLFTAGPSVDASGTLTYTPADDAFGTSTFDVVVQDDGSVANGGIDTSEAQTFTITINPVNDAPSFTGGGDVSVFEDAAYSEAWASNLSTGPANEADQTISFSVTSNSNPGLFSDAPAIDASGTLSFTPAADSTGSATIEVIAIDDGGTDNSGQNESAPVTFTIDVVAASDLVMEKSVDTDFYEPGQVINYTLVVTNAGPSDVTTVQVVDLLAAGLSNASWTCVGLGGGSCPASGSSVIDVEVDLPEASSVTFTLLATATDTSGGAITNSAEVFTPSGVAEVDEQNNADSVTIEAIQLFRDRFEVIPTN